MTQEQLAAVFEEWKRRYDENPEAFLSHEAFVSEGAQTYGDGAARFFLWLVADMEHGGLGG